MAILSIDTVFNIELQFQTAPFHIRMAAWLLDSLVLYIYYLIMSLALDFSFENGQANEYGLMHMLVAIPFLIYHLVSEIMTHGRSLGKIIMGIMVISTNGQKPSISQLLLRWMLRPIDFGFTTSAVFIFNGDLFIGALFLLGSVSAVLFYAMSKHNQRLGDLLAGTTMVSKKLPYQLSDTIFQELDIQGYKVSFPQVMRLSDKDINLLDNLVKQHQQAGMNTYVTKVAEKLKKVLKIETDMPDDFFLEALLRDYNYLSRQT